MEMKRPTLARCCPVKNSNVQYLCKGRKVFLSVGYGITDDGREIRYCETSWLAFRPARLHVVLEFLVAKQQRDIARVADIAKLAYST
jgi:hypothetical protein